MPTLIQNDGKHISLEYGELHEVLHLAAEFGAIIPPLVSGVNDREAVAIAEAIEAGVAYLIDLDKKGIQAPPPGTVTWFNRRKHRRMMYLWRIHRSTKWLEFAQFSRRGTCREE
jgi:hypothetical protein